MKMLLPILLAVIGIAVGGAVGYAFKPAPEPTEEHAADGEHGAAAEHGEKAGHGDMKAKGHGDGDAHGSGLSEKLSEATDSAYIALSRKRIGRFTRENGRKAFVAIDITLEMAPDDGARATDHEPKILDAFLRTLVSFAATAAFDDHAAASHTLRELNSELLKAARAVLEESVRAVLISNLLTQDA